MASPTSSPWLKRCVWITLGLLLGYLVVAAWIFPAVLRTQAERRLSALTGATVRIRAVTFHPFAWRLRVSEISLTDTAGLPLFACSNLVVDAQASSLWRGEAYAREVLVEAPNLALRRTRDGTIPWWQVLERLTSGHASNAPASPRAGLPAFRVDWLGVRNGAISVDDQSTEVPFQAAFRPVNLSLKGFTTRAGEEAAFECQATGDSGETMDWMGRLTVSPPGVTGLWRASRVPVAKPRPYTDEHSTMRPTAGLASWSLPYEVTWRDTGIEARVRGATLGLEGLAVVEKDDGSPFLELARFSVHNASLEWPERRVSVGAVEIESPRLHARRVPAPAGTRAAMNWRQLIDPATVDEWVAFSAGWQLTLDRFSTDAGQVLFEDRTLDPPVRLEVDGVQARVVQLSNASNAAPATVEAGLRWNGKGEVRVTGQLGVRPASAEARVELKDLPIAALAPYLTNLVRLRLQRGLVSGDVTAAYGRRARDHRLALAHAGGTVRLHEVSALEDGTGADFIRWQDLALSGLDLSLEPNRLRVAEVAAVALQTSLVVNTNGQLNVLELLRQSRALTDAADRSAPTAAPAGTAAGGAAQGGGDAWGWPVRIDRVSLKEVALFATDNFYGGGFRTSVESLDGEFRGLEWPHPKPVEMDLKGRLSAVSGFDLTGWVRPEPGAFGADLKLATHRADLAQFAPYSIRFVGYPVKKGELTAQVHYRVEGDALKADNHLLLDQFTLGPRTPSPDALQLPLKLGVALLKDREGRINLDLPLTGTLSDPQFRLAPLVWQALKNVVLKAAAAPFRLLGALFGGGDGGEEELEFVEFAPGTTHLLEKHERRLQALAKGLHERPALELELLPGFDPKEDAHALAMARLDARLLELRKRAMAQLTNTLPLVVLPPAASPDAGLSLAERSQLLRLAYVHEFGAPAGVGQPVGNPETTTPAAAVPADPHRGDAAAAAALALSDAELELRLSGLNPVKPEELRALAAARGEVVRAYLTGTGGLAPERLLPASTNAPAEVLEKARVTFRLE